MARQFISEQRLLAKINATLASDSECCAYTVGSLMRIEKDQTGCNWSVATMSGSVGFRGTRDLQADEIIDAFRRIYNFAE